MRQVTVQGATLQTTAIGFGCSRLTGAASHAEALRLLETAYDHGVRHFDVAPFYGYGAGEAILGEFARGKRDAITIATKYGITVAPWLAHKPGLMGAARKIAKSLPFVKKVLRRAAASAVSAAAFTPDEAQSSLEKSLRNLQTDHVDFLLLHEATRQSAAKPEMIAWLETQIQAGRVRAAGIGSEFHLLGDDAAAFAPVYRVLQFESSIVHPNAGALRHASDRTLMTHGSLHALARLKEQLAARPEARERLRTLLAVDPETCLAPFLIQHALSENAGGLVLFSSSSAARVASTLQAIEEPRYDTSRAPLVISLLRNLLKNDDAAAAATSAGNSK